MKILAIDTATRIAGAAILNDREVITESWLNTGKTHSQKFLPMLKGMLKNADLELSEMDGFAVTLGPGSFTGLRIGIATVQGFMEVTGKPAAGVITLDVLAENLAGWNGLISPVLDARKNEVYTALYRWEAGEMRRLTPHRAISPGQLAEELKSRKEPVTFLGDGTITYRKILEEALGKEASFAEGTRNFIRPSAAADLAMKKFLLGDVTPAQGLKPVYLRLSEAEIKWAAAHGGSIDD